MCENKNGDKTYRNKFKVISKCEICHCISHIWNTGYLCIFTFPKSQWRNVLIQSKMKNTNLTVPTVKKINTVIFLFGWHKPKLLSGSIFHQWEGRLSVPTGSGSPDNSSRFSEYLFYYSGLIQLGQGSVNIHRERSEQIIQFRVDWFKKDVFLSGHVALFPPLPVSSAGHRVL